MAETNSEKLSKLKAKQEEYSICDEYGRGVGEDGVDWLIEQVEKVEQLEKENLLLYGRLNNIIALAQEKI